MEDVKNWKKCPVCEGDLVLGRENDFKACNSCGRQYYNNPVSGVGVIFWNEKGQIILAERAKDPNRGKLDVPGGFLNFGESLEEAAKREIKEEMGIDINIKDLKYLTSVPNIYLYKGSEKNVIDPFFEMKLDDNTISKIEPNDDITSIKLYELSNISDDMIGLSSVKKVIKFLKERVN